MILQAIEHELYMEREFRSKSPAAVALDPISFSRLRTELETATDGTCSMSKGQLTLHMSGGITVKVYRARVTQRDVTFIPFIAFLDEEEP